MRLSGVHLERQCSVKVWLEGGFDRPGEIEVDPSTTYLHCRSRYVGEWNDTLSGFTPPLVGPWVETWYQVTDRWVGGGRRVFVKIDGPPAIKNGQSWTRLGNHE